MTKTLLIVGVQPFCCPLMLSALMHGWAIFYTSLPEEIPIALGMRQVQLILLSGCCTQTDWESLARQVWAISEDILIVALSAEQMSPSQIHTLMGAPPVSLCGVEATGADGQAVAFQEMAGLCHRTQITATLTLLIPLAAPMPDNLRRAMDYITLHYADPISLTEVARAACYSPCHFSKLFKQQVGQSFIQYLSGVRMRHAAELLLCSEKSITDIALEVGYNDLSHFERVFHALYRQSPSQFRFRQKRTISAEKLTKSAEYFEERREIINAKRAE